MSTDTQVLIRSYEELRQARRVEVADFARFLLRKDRDAARDAAHTATVDRWLMGARVRQYRA